MKNLRRLLAVALVLVLAFSLAACSGGSKDVYNVGVCQLMQHVALDDATAGFVQALKDELGEDKVHVNIQNASGEMTLCNRQTAYAGVSCRPPRCVQRLRRALHQDAMR